MLFKNVVDKITIGLRANGNTKQVMKNSPNSKQAGRDLVEHNYNGNPAYEYELAFKSYQTASALYQIDNSKFKELQNAFDEMEKLYNKLPDKNPYDDFPNLNSAYCQIWENEIKKEINPIPESIQKIINQQHNKYALTHS